MHLEIQSFSLKSHCVKSVRICSFLVRIFRIGAEYRDLLRKSQYSVSMRGNTDKKNSEYGHYLRSVYHTVEDDY